MEAPQWGFCKLLQTPFIHRLASNQCPHRDILRDPTKLKFHYLFLNTQIKVLINEKNCIQFQYNQGFVIGEVFCFIYCDFYFS